jgi:hypothetical protein
MPRAPFKKIEVRHARQKVLAALFVAAATIQNATAQFDALLAADEGAASTLKTNIWWNAFWPSGLHSGVMRRKRTDLPGSRYA